MAGVSTPRLWPVTAQMLASRRRSKAEMKRCAMREWARVPPVVCCTMRPLSYSNRPSACEVTNLKKVALSTLMCVLTVTSLPML